MQNLQECDAVCLRWEVMFMFLPSIYVAASRRIGGSCKQALKVGRMVLFSSYQFMFIYSIFAIGNANKK